MNQLALSLALTSLVVSVSSFHSNSALRFHSRPLRAQNDNFYCDLSLSRRNFLVAIPLASSLTILGESSRAEDVAAVASPEAAASVNFAPGFPVDAMLPYKGKELPLPKFRARATVSSPR
jgi:hypothetical protein